MPGRERPCVLQGDHSPNCQAPPMPQFLRGPGRRGRFSSKLVGRLLSLEPTPWMCSIEPLPQRCGTCLTPSSLLHSIYFIVHTPEGSAHSQATGRTEGDQKERFLGAENLITKFSLKLVSLFPDGLAKLSGSV